ncbi:BnaC05g19000D [Brassica napus]|uniref:BnaC05g19000D protein n=1 Tax=Brassica napus TaxID=3708 RepID=A0A078IE45_BRANA|nr:BnaC05g19000D [Brassica napus]
MAKTRWTRRKKTKALKDIATPSKDVPEEIDVEENVVQEEERSKEE